MNPVEKFALCNRNGGFCLASDLHMFYTIFQIYSFPLSLSRYPKLDASGLHLLKEKAGNYTRFAEGFVLSVVKGNHRQLSSASQYVNILHYIE